MNWRCNVYYCIRWPLILFFMSQSHLLKYILCSFYIACIPESEDTAVNNHSSCWSHGFDIGEQMCPPTLNGVSNVHQLCMSQSKMEHRVWQWTNIVPVILLTCFGQPRICDFNHFLLLLILIVLLTSFAAYGKASRCLSFPFRKWVHHLPLGQLKVFISCPINIWKMKSTLWRLRVLMLINVICHNIASCPLFL